MNKSKIMGIGIGRAGNVLLNEFLGKDKRYTGLFVNSAFGDFEGLDKFDINKNAYVFPATNGTGRNRDLAKEFLQDHVQKLADTVARYPMQDVVVIFFSLDGGTGSGITPIFTKMLKRTCPTKKINLVGVIPDFNRADKLSLENTISCWNDVMELVENNKIINDVKFIDNSTRRTFKDVNIKAINDLHAAFSMNGKCEYGTIDDNDAKIVNTANGYGVVLSLDPKYTDVKTAIDNAIQDTVFAKPNQYLCDYVATSLKDFNVNEAIKSFEYEVTAYLAENQHHNTILLGGCDVPSEIIETMKMAYEELENKISNRHRNKTTIVDLNKNVKDKEEKSDIKTSFTSEEIDTMFDDLF